MTGETVPGGNIEAVIEEMLSTLYSDDFLGDCFTTSHFIVVAANEIGLTAHPYEAKAVNMIRGIDSTDTSHHAFAIVDSFIVDKAFKQFIHSGIKDISVSPVSMEEGLISHIDSENPIIAALLQRGFIRRTSQPIWMH